MIRALRKQPAILLAVGAVLLAGCRSLPGELKGAYDFDHALVRAGEINKPIFLLVTESGASQADAHAGALFETVIAKQNHDKFFPMFLDMTDSRNRAWATRYHVTNTPVLLGLSPRGLILTRDQGSITKELMVQRMKEVAARAHELDAKLLGLEEPVAKNASAAEAQLALAEFLLAQQNDREAIPHLELVAHEVSQPADVDQRIQAWVDLVRAHLWIGEPEKGRHEAKELIAVIGTPEAQAGGNLVLGLQDASAKRRALARKEFDAAIAAAPSSVYAREAREALAKLPVEDH